MKKLVAVMISASMMIYASQAPATANAPERPYEVPIRSELTSSQSTPIPCESAAAADGLCTTQLLNGHFFFYPVEGVDSVNYISSPIELTHDATVGMPGFRPNWWESIGGHIQGDPEFFWEYRIYSGNGTEKRQYRTTGSFKPSDAPNSCPNSHPINPQVLEICDVPDSGNTAIRFPQANEYAEVFVHNVPVPGSPVILYDRLSYLQEPVYEGLDHYASGDVVSLNRTAVQHSSSWVVKIDNEKLSLNGTTHNNFENSLHCKISATTIDSSYDLASYPEISDISIKSTIWPEVLTGNVPLEELGITKSGTYVFVISQATQCPSVAFNGTFDSLVDVDSNRYEVDVSSLYIADLYTYHVTKPTKITIPPATTQDPIQGSSNQPTVDPPAAVAVVQTPTTLLPATAKAKKSLKILAKTSAGLPIKVKVKGSCSVKAKTKTTVKKVGKKKVKTKSVVSYNVKLGKKGKTCRVTQTSAGNGTVPAMNSVSVIKIR